MLIPIGPVSVVAGTQYSVLVVGLADTQGVWASNGDPYAGGQYADSFDGGANWNRREGIYDLTFATYVSPPAPPPPPPTGVLSGVVDVVTGLVPALAPVTNPIKAVLGRLGL